MNEKIKKVIKVVICFLVLISLLLLMSTYDIKELLVQYERIYLLNKNLFFIMRIVSRVKDVFRMDIPLKEIITNPTIKGIMNYILSQWTYSEAETIAMAYREYKKILNH